MKARAITYSGFGLVRLCVALLSRAERLALTKQLLIATKDIYDYDQIAVIARRFGLYSANTPTSQIANALQRIQLNAVKCDPEFTRELLNS